MVWVASLLLAAQLHRSLGAITAALARLTGHHSYVDELARRGLPASARIALERTERIAATLVGQTEDAARSAADEEGIAVRIAARDGQSFPLRADMQFSRVNLVIDGGVVTDAVASEERRSITAALAGRTEQSVRASVLLE